MPGTDRPSDVELVAHAAALEADVREWRRELHGYPEPGFGEFRTAVFISEHLRTLGYTVRIAEEAMDSTAVLSRDDVRIEQSFQRAAAAGIDLDVLQRLREHGTAVIADLHFGDGPVIGLRVDIDGLPIAETTAPDHRPVVDGYRSGVDDEMHACGHDGHVAIGLGVASILTRLRSRLHGTVRLIFQPAEEGALGGAAAIAARGLTDDLDAILSFHLGLGVPSGTFVTHGTLMATSKFRITLRGHPSHPVLAPHEGRNALLAASSAALALHAIAPHPDGWFNLNVGMLRAGESQGVTPGLAVLELGVWTTSSNVHSYLKARISEIAAGVASIWQVDAEIQHIGDAPLADHDESLGLVAREVARMTPGIDYVVETLQLSAADDATVLLEHVSAHGGRGIYSVIGSDLADGHHTPAFDFDEASLLHGTTVVSGIISSLLR